MAEYSKLAQGTFACVAQQQMINLPFVPDYVKVTNISGSNHVTSGDTNSLEWVSAMNQGDGILMTQGSGGVLLPSSAAPNGISTFSAGLSFQYAAPVPIVSVTKASNALVTTSAPHGLVVGNVVLLENISGMQQMAGIPLEVVTVPSTTTFTVLWNTNQSNYTAISGSPAGAIVKQILYPFLYSPGVCIIEAVSTGTTTQITTTTPHNYVVGQEVAFRIPSLWGITQLNTGYNFVTPGSPRYAYVTSIVSSTAFVVNVNSTGFTPYTSNIVVTAVPGMSFPQVLAVGDVNSGGWPISSGSVLYPPPVVGGVNTINGPAIQGAFVNNTRMGFVIGSALLTPGAVGTSTYFWEAELHDYLQYNSVGVAVS